MGRGKPYKFPEVVRKTPLDENKKNKFIWPKMGRRFTDYNFFRRLTYFHSQTIMINGKLVRVLRVVPVCKIFKMPYYTFSSLRRNRILPEANLRVKNTKTGALHKVYSASQLWLFNAFFLHMEKEQVSVMRLEALEPCIEQLFHYYKKVSDRIFMPPLNKSKEPEKKIEWIE